MNKQISACFGVLLVAFSVRVIAEAQQNSPAPRMPSAAPNVLRVKCGALKQPQALPFEDSFAFRDGVNRLVLVFHGKLASTTRVSLVVLLSNYSPHGLPRYSRVGTGSYRPVLTEKPDGLLPDPTLVVEMNDGKPSMVIGAFWNITSGAETKREFWGTSSFDSWRGVVTVTESGDAPGGRIKGTIDLGDEVRGNSCVGRFDIPVVQEPKGRAWYDK